MYFSILATFLTRVAALSYSSDPTAFEPMVLSCTAGPSALECYKRFNTNCDADCNIINPAPMNLAGGNCSNRTCACVDINDLNGTDASGLAISTYTTGFATKTNIRVGKTASTTQMAAYKNATGVAGHAPTGHCHYHHA